MPKGKSECKRVIGVMRANEAHLQGSDVGIADLCGRLVQDRIGQGENHGGVHLRHGQRIALAGVTEIAELKAADAGPGREDIVQFAEQLRLGSRSRSWKFCRS